MDSYEAHEIDDLANIAFLSQKANRSILKSPPSDYLPKLEQERLRTQLVPLRRDLWQVGKYREFLRERRNMLAEAINRYLRELGQGYFVES